MKKILIIIGAVILSLAITLPVLASNYTANINITNGSITYYHETPVIVAEDNSYLSTNNYILSSGLDIQIKDNTNVLPSMVTTKQLLFIPPDLNPNAIYNFQWSSGNTALASMPIIVGNNGYITTADTAALEPANNFSIITNGYINTSAASTLNTLTNVTGTATGSPITLTEGTNTITITKIGTFTIFLNGGNTATVTSGSTTVTGSPVSLVGGSTKITTTGSTGNFTVVVTLGSKNIVSKTGALSVYVDPTTSGTIDATIPTTSSQTTGSQTTALYSGSTTMAGERFTAFTSGAIINSITVRFTSNIGSPTGFGYLRIRRSDTDALLGTLGSVDVSTLTSAPTDVTFNSTPVSIGAITDIRICFEYTGGSGSAYPRIYYDNANVFANGVQTTYTGSWTDTSANDFWWQNLIYSTPTVSVAGVSSGVHTITLSETAAASGTLTLTVDTLTPSTITGVGSVPDTANAWIIDQNNVMPYIYYYKEIVGGVEKLLYQPNTILASSTSSYTAGTATFTTSSVTVTGAATTWTQSMVGGQIEDTTSDNIWYQIKSVESATSLTLTTVYTQTGGSGQSYILEYYPTAILPNSDDGTHATDGVITLGTNVDLGLTNSMNNVPTIQSFAPTAGSGGTSPYAPPVVPNPDVAKIPASLGGSVTNYTDGTVTFTNGSNLVVGNGTSWISTMSGGQIKLNADGVYYTIAGVTSSTNLSLTANYTNAGGTGDYYMQYLTGGSTSEDILQTNNLLTPWFQPWANLTNIPLLTFFLLIGTAILLGVVVWVMKETQNQFVGGFVMIVGESFLYKLGIYELWFVIATGLICFALIVFERKPAL